MMCAYGGVARAAVFLFAVSTTTHAWAITSTYVQGSSGRSWLDPANWANGDVGPPPPTLGGGTVPNAIGDVAILQQKVTSGTQGAGNTFQISLGNGSVTIGELTVRNADNAYTTAIVTGTLNFDNGASPSVLNENMGTVVPLTNHSRTRINVPVNIAGDMIVNQHHNLGFNTATEFVQIINQPAGTTFTKNGLGNLQLAYGGAVGPTEGIQGQVLINEGAIRLINGTGNANTVFSRSSGLRVADGAQLQLGNGITSFGIGEVSPGVKAEVALNGLGNTNPTPGFTYGEGALRFEESAGLGFVVDFNSPIRLETQSRIYVTAADTTAILHEEVRGNGNAGLNKGGPGLLKLATASPNGNTYAGNTNVSNGALAVNNSVPSASGVGTGDMFINNGGLVGGTGTIGTASDASNVNVTDGILSPGDLEIVSESLSESAGTLTVFGNVTFTNQSFLNIDLGATSDQLVVSGDVNLGGSTLNLSLDGFVPDGVQSFTLISNLGANAITDVFGTINIDGVAAVGPEFDLNGKAYLLSYAAGAGGNDLMLLPATAPGLDADYNGDGAVDAADYVIWRKGGPLLNEVDAPGTVNEQDYLEWKERFGTSAGGGAGGGAVPEPSTVLLAVLACFLAITKRR